MVASVRDSALIKLFLGGGESLPQFPAETVDELAEMFRSEVESLESHLGRNLEHWKIARTPRDSRVPVEDFASSSMPGTACSAR